MPAAKASKLTYQLKMTIKDIKPPIWRRVRVPANIKLSDLHGVIQTLFYWTGSHMHEFRIDRESYGVDDDCLNEAKYRLQKVIGDWTSKFEYTYDFGDDWKHEIVVEKIEPGDQKPVCLAGKRNSPPEDCGGPYGYAETIASMEGWDPEAFDIDDINAALADPSLRVSLADLMDLP